MQQDSGLERMGDIISATRHLRLLKSGKQEITIDEKPPEEKALALAPKIEREAVLICSYCKQECGEMRHGWVLEAETADASVSHFGPHTNWRQKLIPCPVCSGEAIKKRAAHIRSETINRLFGNARLPWQARAWEFSTYPQDADQEALAAVQSFVAQHLSGDEETKRGLYLGGATGRCKTSLAISALKEVMYHGESGLFVMTMELMDKLRATFHHETPGSVTQDELLFAVASVPWLVMDDLAVERPTPYVLEKLYFLIEKRRSAGLYTIITSNLSTKNLEEYWRPDGVKAGAFHPGVRVIERIREYCIGCAVRGRNQREANW